MIPACRQKIQKQLGEVPAETRQVEQELQQRKDDFPQSRRRIRSSAASPQRFLMEKKYTDIDLPVMATLNMAPSITETVYKRSGGTAVCAGFAGRV